MIKILVTDFDRTFYLNEEDLDKNKRTIRKWRERGNLFVIATGRSYLDLMEDVVKYNILFDYAIIDHGATIIDSNSNILFNFPICSNTVDSLRLALELDKSIFLFCCSKLESRVDLEHSELSKIGINYEEHINISDLNNKINSIYPVNTYITGEHSLEIISQDTNKSNAIKVLSHNLNIDKSQIYTIGDSYNDINMIKDYNGFCMKNSITELKSISQKEYTSVSNLVMDILEK